MKIYLYLLIFLLSAIFYSQKAEAVNITLNKNFIALLSCLIGTIQSGAALFEILPAIGLDIKIFFVDLLTKNSNRESYNNLMRERTKYNLSTGLCKLLSGAVAITAGYKLLINEN